MAGVRTGATQLITYAEVETGLSVMPLFVAYALSVVLTPTVIAPEYNVLEEVGVLPSVV